MEGVQSAVLQALVRQMPTACFAPTSPAEDVGGTYEEGGVMEIKVGRWVGAPVESQRSSVTAAPQLHAGGAGAPASDVPNLFHFQVGITAHHNGRFEFKICRILAPAPGQTWVQAEAAQMTQECFNQVRILGSLPDASLK